MQTNTGSQMSESTRLAVLLAIVGGFLESYTFFCRGGVFANCQTGNLVMMALNIAQGAWDKTFYYAVPIIAFLIGIFLTEYIRAVFLKYPKMHWRQIVILFEIISLLICAFIPCGKYDMIVTTLISFVCSMQVESFRKLHGNIFASTMCTGNLRSAADNLFVYIKTGDKTFKTRSFRYFLIVFIFMLGAVIGGFITKGVKAPAVLFCCLVLFIVFLMMFKNNGNTENA